MKKIFAGLIFILFNVHVTLGGYMIGLLPDFVGYLLPMTRREGLLAVLDVLATLCFLVMVYKIVGGVKALEKKHLCTLSTRRLMPLAIGYAVCNAGALLIALTGSVLAAVVAIIGLAVAFVFVVTFYDTTNKYRYLQHI